MGIDSINNAPTRVSTGMNVINNGLTEEVDGNQLAK